MTDHCKPDFCLWQTIYLFSVPCISSMCHMYMTDFAYDRPNFLVPLSLSYASSLVFNYGRMHTLIYKECLFYRPSKELSFFILACILLKYVINHCKMLENCEGLLNYKYQFLFYLWKWRNFIFLKYEFYVWMLCSYICFSKVASMSA